MAHPSSGVAQDHATNVEIAEGNFRVKQWAVATVLAVLVVVIVIVVTAAAAGDDDEKRRRTRRRMRMAFGFMLAILAVAQWFVTSL
jgi:hypothetical protein